MFRDFKNGDFVLCEAPWSYLCSYVDGKNTKWCCQGWPKWKFQNGEGLVLGSNEKGQIWMKEICTKIDGMESGDVI